MQVRTEYNAFVKCSCLWKWVWLKLTGSWVCTGSLVGVAISESLVGVAISESLVGVAIGESLMGVTINESLVGVVNWWRGVVLIQHVCSLGVAVSAEEVSIEWVALRPTTRFRSVGQLLPTVLHGKMGKGSTQIKTRLYKKWNSYSNLCCFADADF